MCEEELQGVLDESLNTPPHHPRPCRVAGQWSGVGMMFKKFLIALGVCVAVTVGLLYAKENGERSGSRPLGHLWSLFHLFGDQCETNSKTSLTSRPQEVFSSSHQLPCYRIHRRLVIVRRERMPVAIHCQPIIAPSPSHTHRFGSTL